MPSTSRWIIATLLAAALLCSAGCEAVGAIALTSLLVAAELADDRDDDDCLAHGTHPRHQYNPPPRPTHHRPYGQDPNHFDHHFDRNDPLYR